jgi:hypothetical protein
MPPQQLLLCDRELVGAVLAGVPGQERQAPLLLGMFWEGVGLVELVLLGDGQLVALSEDLAGGGSPGEVLGEAHALVEGRLGTGPLQLLLGHHLATQVLLAPMLVHGLPGHRQQPHPRVGPPRALHRLAAPLPQRQPLAPQRQSVFLRVHKQLYFITGFCPGSVFPPASPLLPTKLPPQVRGPGGGSTWTEKT